MVQKEGRQNFVGVGGWVWAGKFKVERYLYFLHRITGLGLILFIIFHLLVTTVFRVQGQDVWETAMSYLNNPVMKVGEYLVVVAFVFHTLNGFRLIFQELGFTLGKPVPPVYPFKDSLRKKRGMAIGFSLAIVILSLLFLYNFIAGGW